MKRFRNILFVTRNDAAGPGATFDRALRLAAANDARLVVVRLANVQTRWSANLTRFEESGRLRELQAWLVRATEANVTATARVMIGNHWRELMNLIVSDRHDLLITHLQPAVGLQEWVYGSTTLQLLRKCPCAVWVMKPDPPTTFGGILAAIDPDDPVDPGLNLKILQMASSLAEQERGRLEVIHGWSYFAEQMLRNRARLSDEQIAELLAEQETQHRRKLEQSLDAAGLDLEPARIHLIHGRPAAVIINHLIHNHVDLLVMGTVCRAGVSGLLIGNTAETVLEEVPCPVLAVKPDGFCFPFDTSIP